jgi:hypothetical protein
VREDGEEPTATTGDRKQSALSSLLCIVLLTIEDAISKPSVPNTEVQETRTSSRNRGDSLSTQCDDTNKSRETPCEGMIDEIHLKR